MRFLLKFAFVVLLLAFMVASGKELWSRYSDTLNLDQRLDQKARELLNNNRPAEAQLLAAFVLQHPATGDTEQSIEISQAATTQINSTRRKLEQFARGAWTGEPVDIASFLGSMSLDLFVIGDVRDLAIQSWKQWKDDDGDELIMALSAAGLVTALAPEIHWAPSMMKGFKRTGSLSKPFVANVKSTARQAIKARKSGALADILKDFGTAAKNLGPGPFSTVMKNVDKASELKKISKAAAIDPKSTYVVSTAFGKNGVKRISNDGRNIGKLAGKIRLISRAGKISKKAFSLVPDWVLAVFMAAAFGLIFWLTRSCQSKRFRNAITLFAANGKRSQNQSQKI